MFCGIMFDFLQCCFSSLSQKPLMKNLSILRTFLFFAFLTIALTNCRTKPEIIDPVVILGQWDVVEFKIDAEEQLGNTYNSVVLNFGEIRDGAGPFAVTTEDMNGSSLSQGGEYSFSVDFDIIYITIIGKTIEYAVNFDFDNLIMQGTDQNNQTIIYNCDKVE